MEEKKRELQREVEVWVDRTFNYIQIDSIRKVFGANGEYIEDLIEQLGPDYNDFFQNYNKIKEYKEWLIEKYDSDEKNNYDNEEYKKEFVEQDIDFQSYQDDTQENNYPMWNTCFELRSEWSSITDNAQEAGFGIINQSKDFNSFLFVSGAGYSFHAQHWIPLYLSIFDYEREKYKGIDYSDL